MTLSVGVTFVLWLMFHSVSVCMCVHCLGRVPESLQIMDNMTSSAPPPMESRRRSRYILLTSTSDVYPIPPQYCIQESVTSREIRPAFSFAIEASLVTSCPLRYRPAERERGRVIITQSRQAERTGSANPHAYDQFNDSRKEIKATVNGLCHQQIETRAGIEPATLWFWYNILITELLTHRWLGRGGT